MMERSAGEHIEAAKAINIETGSMDELLPRKCLAIVINGMDGGDIGKISALQRSLSHLLLLLRCWELFRKQGGWLLIR